MFWTIREVQGELGRMRYKKTKMKVQALVVAVSCQDVTLIGGLTLEVWGWMMCVDVFGQIDLLVNIHTVYTGAETENAFHRGNRGRMFLGRCSSRVSMSTGREETKAGKNYKRKNYRVSRGGDVVRGTPYFWESLRFRDSLCV